MTRKSASIALFAFSILLPSVCRAQSASFEDWQNTIAAYGFLTSLDGDMTLGRAGASVDVAADQILDALEAAAMVRYRGQGGRWAFVVDGIFAGLGGTREGTLTKQDLDVDLFIVQSDAAFRFDESLELLFGARYVLFESRLQTTTASGGGERRDNDASFVDPVVGVRYLGAPGARLRLQAQADIGGGLDMDLTWQAMVNLGWQANERVSLWLGYRALEMEFDESGERNRFGADLVMHGPLLGAAFHF
jgi:hypothetical protein